MARKNRPNRTGGRRSPEGAAVPAAVPDGRSGWRRVRDRWAEHGPMLRFVAVFGGLLAAYFALSLTLNFKDPGAAAEHPVVARVVAAGEVVRARFISPYQALIATVTGKTLNLLGDRVTVRGNEVRSDRFAVAITGGCDGIELNLLLLAAIVAFPAPFRKKLWGMALGLACLVVANYARVVSLWFIGVHWPAGFDAAHFSVWPLLLICCAMGLFLRWLRYAADAPPAA
jgi:exosortase H (IPTLxxWG-CTERM-specific)